MNSILAYNEHGGREHSYGYVYSVTGTHISVFTARYIGTTILVRMYRIVAEATVVIQRTFARNPLVVAIAIVFVSFNSGQVLFIEGHMSDSCASTRNEIIVIAIDVI